MNHWGESMLEMRARHLAQKREAERQFRKFDAMRFAHVRGYVVCYRNRFDKPHICRPR
jgi:hypothetical protein